MANNEEVKITQPPVDPLNAFMSRNDNTITLAWGRPSQATWDDRPDRWTNTDAQFLFTPYAMVGVDNDTWVHSNDGSRHVTGDKIWVHDLGVATEATADYNRNRYHPVTLDRRMLTITGIAIIQNSVGEKRIRATYMFEYPLPPNLSTPVLDASTMEVVSTASPVYEDEQVVTYKAPDAQYRMYTTHKECYDVAYKVLLQSNAFSGYSKPVTILEEQYSKEQSVDIAVDVTDNDGITLNLEPGQWIRVTFSAYARGIAGNSPVVTKHYVFAHPDAPTITKVTVTNPNLSSGIVNISVDVGSLSNWKLTSTQYVLDHVPVESVKLQRLKSTTATTPAAAREVTSGWEDVQGAVDNWNCRGFTDNVLDALPDRGKYTYYRAVSTNGQYTTYGEPFLADTLVRDAHPVSDDQVAITSVVSGDDGESLKVYLGWDDDDSTGTEVSWSDKEDAWYSTEQPSTYDVTWEDSPANPPSGTSWAHTAMLVIRGLQESTKYYIKARRFSDAEDERVYSTIHVTSPDASFPAVPYTSPSNVILSAPSYVKQGSDLDFTWTFDSDSIQKEWALYRVKADGSKVAVANGEDSIGVATVDAGAVADMVADQGDQTLAFYLSMTTGGSWVDSDQVSVTVQNPPSISISTAETLTMQPMQFGVKSDSQNVSLSCKVVASGTMALTPDGDDSQLSGDVIWSDLVTPTWYEMSKVDDADTLKHVATVPLPKNLKLYDNCRYDLHVTATDSETGLSSEESIFQITVDYDHKAQSSPEVEIVTDRDSRSVSITPAKPLNWMSTDVFDLYRVTPDGIYQIGSGTEFGATVTDRYAPYAKVVPLKYRVCTRTADNDVEWIDYDYSMHVPTMRFDWGDSDFVELPYDIEVSDAYTKDFESRTHIDGTTIGYWNPGVTHKGTLKTKLLRLTDPDQIRAVHALSQHSGPVFVRLPNGLAYAANVSVTSIDDNYTQLVKNVSITADEIELVDAFKPAAADYAYEEGFTPDPGRTSYSRTQLLSWTEDRTSLPGAYVLHETPSSSVLVKMTVSSDGYVQETYLNAGTGGAVDPKALTVYELSGDVQDYVDAQPEGTQFILKALYDV